MYRPRGKITHRDINTVKRSITCSYFLCLALPFGLFLYVVWVALPFEVYKQYATPNSCFMQHYTQRHQHQIHVSCKISHRDINTVKRNITCSYSLCLFLPFTLCWYFASAALPLALCKQCASQIQCYIHFVIVIIIHKNNHRNIHTVKSIHIVLIIHKTKKHRHIHTVKRSITCLYFLEVSFPFEVYKQHTQSILLSQYYVKIIKHPYCEKKHHLFVLPRSRPYLFLLKSTNSTHNQYYYHNIR